MSNSIKRCFMNFLSQDNTDLTDLEIVDKKAEIINLYETEYNINPVNFTFDYWLNAGRYHYQSLKILLQSTETDWYKTKIIPFKRNIDTQELPLIQLQCGQKVNSYSENITGFEGNLQIIINTSSVDDMSLGECIAWRIINLLDLNGTSFGQEITVPNNLNGLNYSFVSRSNQTDSYDTLILDYYLTGTFLS